jgi:hypothetical protein
MDRAPSLGALFLFGLTCSKLVQKARQHEEDLVQLGSSDQYWTLMRQQRNEKAMSRAELRARRSEFVVPVPALRRSAPVASPATIPLASA